MKMRFGSTVAFATVPSVALALAWGVGGCGGIVREGGPDDGGFTYESGGRSVGTGSGGRTGSGSSTSTGARPGSGGSVAKPPPVYCGNGVVDDGEDCDGALIKATCALVTMGAKPAGTVRCTDRCTYNTSGCVSPNVGGRPGTGGFTGTGGSPATGGATYESCMNTTTTIIPNACTAPCGCKVCPDIYAACRADGGCSWILACAQQQGCASVSQCYSTSCSSIINTSGGLMSLGSRLADPALACLAQSGCGVACR
jgi:hypothetical protein